MKANGERVNREVEQPRVDVAGLVRLTQELVRIPSVHAPEAGRSEAPAAALVAQTMRDFGWQVEVEEVAPGRPNVIGTIEGGLPGPTLLFEGHTDVVTEGALDGWSFPPFSGDLVEGNIRGRGAADMKGGVAAMLFAVAALAETRPFPGRVVVGALTDEEGMMSGVKHFVTSGRASAIDAAIVCEPEGGEVCAVQKGALRLRVEAHGIMAHGAMPDQGRNPIPALHDVVVFAAALQRRLQALVGRHPLLGQVWITPTVFVAGDPLQMNVIPAVAQVAFDVRTVPGLDHGEMTARFEQEAVRLSAVHGVRLEVTVVDDRPPTETPEDSPLVRSLVQAHEKVTGIRPPFGGVPGTTDGTILFRDAGLPVVVYGPGEKWIAHQADEYVAVADLVTCAEVYLVAAELFLHSGAADAPDLARIVDDAFPRPSASADAVEAQSPR
jgi:succinyl-diaminopimelate desuccinylase